MKLIPKKLAQQSTYPEEASGISKKQLYIGGGILLAIVTALALLLTSGGAKPGQAEMAATLQPLSEAVAITKTYEKQLSRTDVKNDMTLVKILLQSNYQPLNDLYSTTFTPVKKFSSNPKPDDESVEKLDAAVKKNTLDDEIINVLGPKVATAANQLKRARPNFSKQESVNTIETAQKALESVLDILNRAR